MICSSAGRPRRARASSARLVGRRPLRRRRWGSTRIGRRGRPRRPAASPIAALTVTTWSIASTASPTRAASRGPARRHVEHVGPVAGRHDRHIELGADRGRRPAVGDDHVRVDDVERPALVDPAQRPADRPQHRVGVECPQARAGQRQLARVEDLDALDRRRSPGPGDRPAQRGSSGGAHPFGRDHAHVVPPPLRGPAPARARRSRPSG